MCLTPSYGQLNQAPRMRSSWRSSRVFQRYTKTTQLQRRQDYRAHPRAGLPTILGFNDFNKACNTPVVSTWATLPPNAAG
jgi:hypothetical protein